jgi:hypothetical protein
MRLLRLYRSLGYEALSVWREAEPAITKILAHLLIFACAAVCLAIALLITWGLLSFCDLLFGDNEYSVKVGTVIMEILLSLYLIRFVHRKKALLHSHREDI